MPRWRVTVGTQVTEWKTVVVMADDQIEAESRAIAKVTDSADTPDEMEVNERWAAHCEPLSKKRK